MSVVFPRFTASLSRVLKLQHPRTILPQFLILLCLALGLSGCHARSVAPANSLTPARSLSGVSPTIGKVQSAPLYQQARQACTRRDYVRAAQLLERLTHTPDLPPEALAFVQKQREICLKDAGMPIAAPTVSPPPVLAPADADCGPRALVLLCKKLGVKTDLETLRKTAGTTAQGTTMQGLQQAAEKLGLKAEGVQVSREALPDVSTPAIAWDRRHHFIVLLALSGSDEQGTATLHDPNQSAEETLSQESLLQRCGGYLLLVHR